MINTQHKKFEYDKESHKKLKYEKPWFYILK